MIRLKHKNRITKQGNRFTENGFLVLFFLFASARSKDKKIQWKIKVCKIKISSSEIKKQFSDSLVWFSEIKIWSILSLKLFLFFQNWVENILSWGFFAFLSVFWKSEKVNDFMPFSHCCLICFVYSLRIIRLIQIKIVPLQGKNYILWQIVK